MWNRHSERSRKREPDHVTRQPTAEIALGLSLSLVPSHCRALDVGSRRADRPAIGTLNRECTAEHDLGPVPAKWAGLQYRDDLILFHLLLAVAVAL